MTPGEIAAVLAAGLGAGVLSSTVGVASLLSFPVLVAIGLPPVTANVSNTIGLAPAGISGSVGYREELRAHPSVTRLILGVCAVGAVLGAVLLLALPPGVFEAIVPWLILFTCLLVGVQPRLSAWLRRRHGEDAGPRIQPSGATTLMAGVTGVYGGYFGAGAGVMMVAVLGLGTDIELRVINGLKTMALMVGNVIAGLIFAAIADVNWTAAALLAGGSVIGGYVGARIGRRLPDGIFRGFVVVAGVAAAGLMLR